MSFQLGQRSNLKKTELITDLRDCFKRIDDPRITVTSIVEMGSEAVMVTTSPASEECEEETGCANVVDAAFTTAHARLRLLDSMEKLDGGVMYTDTGK